MSSTKAMQKWLKTASVDDVRKSVAALQGTLSTERNMMLRSSLMERLRMAERVLADEARWAHATTMHDECFGMHNVQ